MNVRAINVQDLRSLAQRRLPRVVFDYMDGGAEDETTLRENCRAFQGITFRPCQAAFSGGSDLRTKVLGAELALPFILAPVGYSRVIHPQGEVGAARAAGKAGTAYALSTISGHRLEDVKAASAGPVWFQLYLLAGREGAEGAIERARNAGYAALVVTVDTPVAGMRERDFRNGLVQLQTGNLFTRAAFMGQLLRHPGWLSGFFRDGGLPKLENVIVPGKGPLPLMDVGAALSRTAVTWADMKWLKEAWSGPIVIKGILTGDDARRAVDTGAAAVIVSNHGGRQLDYAPAALKVVPEVVAAVGGQAEVLMDGGIRRGSDVVKALCMGAQAVLVGRAYAYGLGAAGEAGVTRAIEILRADLNRTMVLLGCKSISQLNQSFIQLPRDWS
jgi:isopentenyl diphosphate isomerase/L-lactate dehydrogenase-like FMN-dependent dehydrogenase